ncbi:unnamed protein product [Peniophora sp. CBMAI 1063]|nr:unnamed protein product [Peniophora sp. CBMAI 1063]
MIDGRDDVMAIPFDDLHALYPPSLRSLHIHLEHHGQSAIWMPDMPNALNPNCPNLRNAYFHNFNISLQHPLLIPQLTHLTLAIDPDAIETWNPPKFRDLTDILSRLSVLESFTFQGELQRLHHEDNDIPTDTDGKRIDCPHLRDLLIDVYDPFHVLLLMSRLVLAPTARMSFVSRAGVPLSPDHPMLLRGFRSRMLSQEDSPLAGMKTVQWLTYAPHWADERDRLHIGPVPLWNARAIVCSAWRAGTSEYLKGDLKGHSEPPRPDWQLVFGLTDQHPYEFSPEGLIPFEAFAAAECISFRQRELQLLAPSASAFEALFGHAQTLQCLRVDRKVGTRLLKECAGIMARGSHTRPLGGVKELLAFGINWGQDWTGNGDGGPDITPYYIKLKELIESAQTALQDITIGKECEELVYEEVGDKIRVHTAQLKGPERNDFLFAF